MTNVVHQTLQVTAVIGAGALAVCMMILSVGLVIVIAHDGNAPEVTTAMQIIANVIPTMVEAAAALAGAVGVTAVLTGRFPNGILGGSSQTAGTQEPAAPAR